MRGARKPPGRVFSDFSSHPHPLTHSFISFAPPQVYLFMVLFAIILFGTPPLLKLRESQHF